MITALMAMTLIVFMMMLKLVMMMVTMMLVGDACDIGMTLVFDIRFDVKSISSHVRRRCCSQPGDSLEIDFKSLKGGMSKHKKGLKIDFDFFGGHPPKPNLKLNLSLSHAPHCY